jgi:formylmethanofuran dehydrogenase subunit E
MWQAEQDEIERLLPHCDICGEPIRDKIYRINGETLCSECLDWRFAEDVEDYLDRI